MKKGEFIGISKRMVKEYHNRYVEKMKDYQIIKSTDVEVIGFDEDETCYRILLITPTPDDLYYGVTYDKSTDKLYSYTYKKVGGRINGRKNERSYIH